MRRSTGPAPWIAVAALLLLGAACGTTAKTEPSPPFETGSPTVASHAIDASPSATYAASARTVEFPDAGFSAWLPASYEPRSSERANRVEFGNRWGDITVFLGHGFGRVDVCAKPFEDPHRDDLCWVAEGSDLRGLMAGVRPPGGQVTWHSERTSGWWVVRALGYRASVDGQELGVVSWQLPLNERGAPAYMWIVGIIHERPVVIRLWSMPDITDEILASFRLLD